jgi:hypothetical protein
LPTNRAATEPADFHQPQVQNLYGCFVNLTFCKPDVSDVLKPDVLKPNVLKPDVLLVYLQGGNTDEKNNGYVIFT